MRTYGVTMHISGIRFREISKVEKTLDEPDGDLTPVDGGTVIFNGVISIQNRSTPELYADEVKQDLRKRLGRDTIEVTIASHEMD